jgi:hypothetical protein
MACHREIRSTHEESVMKLLHIYKSEPDAISKTLGDILSEGNQVTEFRLYEGQPDYERLIDLIFEHDKVISWW